MPFYVKLMVHPRPRLARRGRTFTHCDKTSATEKRWLQPGPRNGFHRRLFGTINLT